MNPLVVQIIAATIAAISALTAVYVARRNGQWRETDDAKALLQRVTDVEGRVQAVEIRMEDLPTREDIAELRGEVKAVGRDVAAANSGIDRIENFFLAKGVERVS